jgi:methylphosphotriester-DNA--protein-cysteine methyltransferase
MPARPREACRSRIQYSSMNVLSPKNAVDRSTSTSTGPRTGGVAVGASERTLSRLFRQEAGMTFPQWRTQFRLQHALVLLADRTPVTTTALACGWSNPSAFIETFRRAFGATPGKFYDSGLTL